MKKNFIKVLSVLCLVALGAVAGGVTAYKVSNNDPTIAQGDEFSSEFNTSGATLISDSQTVMAGPVDLTFAAEKSVHAVVHVKSVEHSKTQYVQEMPDIFDFFFGDGQGRQRRVETQPRVGIGSGVIISADGYIVTNNHVIEGADEIDVTLNDKREFKARLVGTDPTTDIALLKIEIEGAPFLTLSNSDNLKVGEWVLAVGNPFNLSSTVTAGIVSAKARNLNIYGGKQGSIESFIQTDAAVNRGNSGGALVNARGELVGINAAIYSPTGVYSGYGFAIPTNLVKAVVVDLKKYGAVQRAQLGIMGGDNNAELAKEKGLGVNYGVYVSEVIDGGSADKAGIKSNDVIIGFNDKKINSMAELQEMVAQTKPDTEVSIKVNRDGKEKTIKVKMKINEEVSGIGDTKTANLLGAKFEKVDRDTRSRLGINGGIEVTKLSNGRLRSEGVQERFIILKANDSPVNSEKDLDEAIKAAQSSDDKVLFIVGIYPAGRRAYYAIDLR